MDEFPGQNGDVFLNHNDSNVLGHTFSISNNVYSLEDYARYKTETCSHAQCRFDTRLPDISIVDFACGTKSMNNTSLQWFALEFYPTIT